MSVQVRSGGNWVSGGKGSIKVRWGGLWNSPNYAFVRWNNQWIDSGYRGFPSTPGAPAVYAWDYNNIGIYWGSYNDGAPVTNYIVERGDYTHGGWVQYDVGTATSFSQPISWDTRYEYRIYSRSQPSVPPGLQTGPGASLRVGIGHPQQDTYGYVTRYRYWRSDVQYNYRFKGEGFIAYVPDSIHLTAIQWQNIRCNTSTLAQDYGLGRYIYTWLNNAAGAPIAYANVANGDTNGVALNNQGGNSYWGIIPVGTGWSDGNSASTPIAGKTLLYADAVYAEGSEPYSNYEVVSSIPVQGNYYW